MTKNTNAAPFVCGVLDFIEDVCEVMGTKVWNVFWALKHLMIHLEGLEYLLLVLEKDMARVKGPGEVNGRLNKRWCTYHFFEKEKTESGRSGTTHHCVSIVTFQIVTECSLRKT